MTVAIEDLAALQYKLAKRGFRTDDLYLHECAACHEHAVLTYVTVAIAIIAPIVLYPTTKALWLAVDLMFRPSESG